MQMYFEKMDDTRSAVAYIPDNFDKTAIRFDNQKEHPFVYNMGISSQKVRFIKSDKAYLENHFASTPTEPLKLIVDINGVERKFFFDFTDYSADENFFEITITTTTIGDVLTSNDYTCSVLRASKFYRYRSCPLMTNRWYNYNINRPVNVIFRGYTGGTNNGSYWDSTDLDASDVAPLSFSATAFKDNNTELHLRDFVLLSQKIKAGDWYVNDLYTSKNWTFSVKGNFVDGSGYGLSQKMPGCSITIYFRLRYFDKDGNQITGLPSAVTTYISELYPCNIDASVTQSFNVYRQINAATYGLNVGDDVELRVDCTIIANYASNVSNTDAFVNVTDFEISIEHSLDFIDAYLQGITAYDFLQSCQYKGKYLFTNIPNTLKNCALVASAGEEFWNKIYLTNELPNLKDVLISIAQMYDLVFIAQDFNFKIMSYADFLTDLRTNALTPQGAKINSVKANESVTILETKSGTAWTPNDRASLIGKAKTPYTNSNTKDYSLNAMCEALNIFAKTYSGKLEWSLLIIEDNPNIVSFMTMPLANRQLTLSSRISSDTLTAQFAMDVDFDINDLPTTFEQKKVTFTFASDEYFAQNYYCAIEWDGKYYLPDSIDIQIGTITAECRRFT